MDEEEEGDTLFLEETVIDAFEYSGHVFIESPTQAKNNNDDDDKKIETGVSFGNQTPARHRTIHKRRNKERKKMTTTAITLHECTGANSTFSFIVVGN